MARIHLVLFLITALSSLLVSAAAPTFCKCTCFTNSTIIPLGPGHEGPPAESVPDKDPPAGEGKGATTSSVAASPEKSTTPRHQPLERDLVAARGAPSSCAQCNRAFCLRYNLPICKGAEEKDVTTMCFQRDSRKDQIIVWGFILGTVGLLGWAGAKHVLEMRDARAAARSGGGSATGGGLGASSGGRAGSGWSRFMRRRGSPTTGGLLSPRDDAARGMYSPLGNTYDGDGDRRGPG